MALSYRTVRTRYMSRIEIASPTASCRNESCWLSLWPANSQRPPGGRFRPFIALVAARLAVPSGTAFGSAPSKAMRCRFTRLIALGVLPGDSVATC